MIGLRIVSELRDQWLSVLVMFNYWQRRHGYAPDEWYWADEELMLAGRHRLPCYWSRLMFANLGCRIYSEWRIVYFRVKIKLIRWGLL